MLCALLCLAQSWTQDLVVIPLYVFDIPDSLALLISLEWCTQLFWNVDIFLSMRTGALSRPLQVLALQDTTTKAF